jgi:tRNA U34 5-methylaminomethyl-2-thiouridine-forming methyltransferase MnmC
MNINPKTHFTTADGSSTLLSVKYGAHYHSLNGAITESMHIYINAGLMHLNLNSISILEVGFGTGLNAALTANRVEDLKIRTQYHSLELYPLTSKEYELLNYTEALSDTEAEKWVAICKANWNEDVSITNFFSIKKINQDFTIWTPSEKYHLVYFDAFAPNDQPEMWSHNQFDKLYSAMHQNGVLVTYCVKGVVKTALKQAGFTIERLPGPPGKNQILRATKTDGINR